MDDYSKYIYSTGTHYISNCGHDENGSYSGGKAGDQTGDEWCLRSWYSRPWDCVLRYPDENVALMIANMACAAALNDNIGYDQNQRDTFWDELQKVNYDPSKITTPCEADCSSGIIAIVKAVGYLMGITALQKLSATYTGNMKSAFKSAGFEVLTASKYISDSSYLKPGDIDLNEAHHTATNVTKGANATFNPDTSSDTDSGTTENSGEMTTTAEPEKIWNFLMDKLGNAYGVAGLMGNLQAESALIPINLQDSFESKLGYTDKTYTEAVDSGKYTKFSSDSAGYGLAQWTYSTRKKALLSYVQSAKASVGNLDAQLGYLWQELQDDYSSLVTTLKKAKTVKTASNAVLTKFEQPADQGTSVKNLRASYGQEFYDKYASSDSSGSTTTEDEPKKTTEEIVQEVIAGKWGNGDERKAALTAAGYDYDTIQAEVNKELGVSTSSTSDLPSYTVGNIYNVLVDGLNVRTGPSTSYAKKSYSQLTTNAKNNSYANGCLKKGARVTCQKVVNSGNEVWMQIPSGYVAAYYNNKKYVG